ncbi:MAG: ATP-binding cassette domain-containing protein [Anaerovoracaceae bacterium]
MNHCFDIKNLTFYYPGQDTPALSGIDFSIAAGEFLALVGPSGCGKSTLLRQLKTPLAPHGIRTGDILFQGRALAGTDAKEQSASIGFVQQSPENQIVTDKVWHELAFGLESLGIDTPTIRRRVAEMAGFFGIESWFYQNVSELSGGQKQIVNLASIMAMNPSCLILDEPTSQLDPIAASEFLSMIGKIHRELGTTIFMTEHRLEEVFPMADRVIAMDRGRIIADGSPRSVGEALKDTGHAMFLAMPTPMRVWASVESDAPSPVTVRDGRDWLSDFAAQNELVSVPPAVQRDLPGEAAVELTDIWFKYEQHTPDVIKGLSLTVRRGEFVAILGGNGTGKTTALSVAGGLRAPYRGKRTVRGSVAILPQNPQTLFVKKTVREDLAVSQGERLSEMIRLCRLGDLLDRHPYDLSGGEQQRLALAKVLLSDPDILLLDEPTKGLDAEFKQVFAGIIKQLLQRGVTVLLVSHDVEFCAEHADRCALFFDGDIVTDGPPQMFFTGNSFYTTAANRMARNILPDAVTVSDLVVACGGSPPDDYAREDRIENLLSDRVDAAHGENISGKDAAPHANTGSTAIGASTIEALQFPLWRKLLAVVSGVVVAWSFFKAVRVADLSALLTADGPTDLSGDYMALYAALIASLFVFAFAVARKAPPPAVPMRMSKAQRKLPKRTIAAAAMILLLIPLTIFIGAYYLDGRRYYLIAMLILLETMVPFFLVFEGRKPQARELVVIAVLCALGVASRAALFMLPNFKPVMALVILAGVAFGGETGFLVGAMTMLASNTMFGQGPWTPWQMFAMGIVGFLAGVLFRKGVLRRTRASLCTFGAISAVVIYGGIMNPAAALLWARTLTPGILLPYFMTGLPVDLIHAAATALILWFAAEPMLEKLDRVKTKYGLIESRPPVE